MAKNAAIGIDLGTTNCCVGVSNDGIVKIVENRDGNRTTPSIIAFNNLELIVGNSAKDQLGLNPPNTVYDAKRMIGRNFDDPVVQADRKLWPFNIAEVHGKLKIEVEYKGETITYFPEQISAMLLTTMKEECEAFLGYKVTNAVITVPAYFNDSQRQATKEAGSLAGLKVLRIINEPTAAAIAYGFGEKFNVNKKVLIYNLGGGTFDTCILSIEKGVFNVIAMAGDTHLGGQDFDQRMAQYLADEFKKKHKKDCSNNKGSIGKLMGHSERAKRALSSCKETMIFIESLFDGIDFQWKMTQTCFNDLNEDLFEATIDQVKKVLKDSKLEKKDIDEVILVGGSTRIPRVQELLKEFFNGKVLNERINVDEAVAIGAAIQASILNGDFNTQTQIVQLHDITAHSLSTDVCVGDESDVMGIVIEKNTPFPTKVTRGYTTFSDNQTSLSCKVFQGENRLTKDNHYLGEYLLQGIPPRRAREERIDLTFDINANGLLNVTAVIRSTGEKKDIIRSRLVQTEKILIEDDEKESVNTLSNNKQ